MCYILWSHFSPTCNCTSNQSKHKGRNQGCSLHGCVTSEDEKERGLRSQYILVFLCIYVRSLCDYGPYSFFPKATATMPAKPPRMPGIPCRLWTPQVSWMPRWDERTGYREEEKGFWVSFQKVKCAFWFRKWLLNITILKFHLYNDIYYITFTIYKYTIFKIL